MTATACSEASNTTTSISTPSNTLGTLATTTTTEPTTTSTAAPTTTTSRPSEPEFTAEILPVSAELLAHSYRPDCPVAIDDLSVIQLVHWGFDGEIHNGAIVVASSEAENVVDIFRRLFDNHFPIATVIPIGDMPEGVEDTDPNYNNTSGLHCRRAVGSDRWSEHARGLAIDINPLQNPFVTDSTLWPANSERYLDRDLGEAGMIVDGDETVSAFADHGWLWGGNWSSIKDYHHFSTSGR